MLFSLSLAKQNPKTTMTTSPNRLDCETRESTVASLCQAFQCSAESFLLFVQDPVHGLHYDEHWRDLPEFQKYLFERAISHFGNPQLPSEVCWFHGTRVPHGTTFQEGIFPLGQRIDSLKEAVLATLDNDQHQEQVRQAFARKGGYAYHFREKITNTMHWGPYAILIRELAFHAESCSQHDYLGMPEIIDDLCEEIRIACKLDLLPIFQERWRPALVKFVAVADSLVETYLGVALCYLRSALLEGAPDSNSVMCFDGENTPVSPEQIIRVDFV